jgi:hypothetical protein
MPIETRARNPKDRNDDVSIIASWRRSSRRIWENNRRVNVSKPFAPLSRERDTLFAVPDTVTYMSS